MHRVSADTIEEELNLLENELSELKDIQSSKRSGESGLADDLFHQLEVFLPVSIELDSLIISGMVGMVGMAELTH